MQINLLSTLLCPCGTEGTGFPVSIYNEGSLVVPTAAIIDFSECFTVTSTIPGGHYALVEFTPDFTFDCVTYQLDLCGNTVDLSCLAG
jgi:hypothetical protein